MTRTSVPAGQYPGHDPCHDVVAVERRPVVAQEDVEPVECRGDRREIALGRSSGCPSMALIRRPACGPGQAECST